MTIAVAVPGSGVVKALWLPEIIFILTIVTQVILMSCLMKWNSWILIILVWDSVFFFFFFFFLPFYDYNIWNYIFIDKPLPELKVTLNWCWFDASLVLPTLRYRHAENFTLLSDICSYTPRNEVRGGILDSACLSVCPSVCLSVCLSVNFFVSAL